MLTCDSYYFSAKTHSEIVSDRMMKYKYLCIRCNFKNYDGEIDKFVDWIMPYLEEIDGDFLGFSRYEEFNDPKLICMAKADEDE